MAPLKIKLYATEFYGMASYLSDLQPLRARSLEEQSVISLMLIDYMDYWHQERITRWLEKSTKRRQILSMPVPVAVAMHKVMWKSLKQLTDAQRMFYTELSLAITNYQRDSFTPFLTVYPYESSTTNKI